MHPSWLWAGVAGAGGGSWEGTELRTGRKRSRGLSHKGPGLLQNCLGLHERGHVPLVQGYSGQEEPPLTQGHVVRHTDMRQNMPGGAGLLAIGFWLCYFLKGRPWASIVCYR